MIVSFLVFPPGITDILSVSPIYFLKSYEILEDDKQTICKIILDFNNYLKQVKKIYKLIYETQYLIHVNDQISLSYSCILLYYNMFIYQDNKNDEVCNFINDSFNKNIIKNKELL